MEIAADEVDRIKTKVWAENGVFKINIPKLKWEIISLSNNYV